MEKPDGSTKSKIVTSSERVVRSTGYSPLQVGESDFRRESDDVKIGDEKNNGIRSQENMEANFSRRGNTAAEGDYVSISNMDEFNGQSLNNGARDSIRNTLISDVGDTALGDNIESSDHFDSSRVSFTRPDQSRPRSLSKISEKSHIGSDMETKDDLYIPKTTIDYMSHIENSRTISETMLAGSDDDVRGDQHAIFYDAQVSNGHAGKSANQQEAAIRNENDSVIVSGNVRNGHNISKHDAINRPKIHISPISKHAALTATDVASESTPKPSTADVFKFPSLKPDSTNSTTNISSSPDTTDHRPLASRNGDVSKVNDPSMFTTEAIVHTNTTPSAEDIPLSLRNLVFLTKSEPPASGPSEDSSVTAANPGLLLTHERKRSNLKKPNISAATSSQLLGPVANSSISSSTSSINTIGNKKSIKWGSDVHVLQKSQNETQASAPQDASKLHPPTSKETANRDSSRKISTGQASNNTDRKDPESITAEVQDPKDGRGGSGDKTSFHEADRGSTRVNSGYSTPVRTSGYQELAGNAIVRALKGVKGKSQPEDKNASFTEEIDLSVGSLGHLSWTGGMSTPGDLTPKGYLTDNEDTVTSMDDVVERRDKTAMYGLERSSAAAAESSPLRDSVVSDDVFKPTAAPDRTGKTKSAGCIPDNLRNSLALILSGIYGIVIVVLGLVLPLSETFANPEHPYFFEVFYLYLYAVSLAFLVYVYTYLLRKERSLLQGLPKTISRTLSRTFSRSSVRSRTSVASEKSGSVAGKLVRGNSNQSFGATSYRRRRKIAYNPEVSKHTGSFFLRVGVIGFGIGSMIHSALTFGHYFEVSHLDSHCSDAIQAIKPLAHLCFTFVQMYFIFMNSKMCVHKYKTLARFGLMHMSCTNICVWLRSVVVETLQVIKVDRRDTYNAMVKAYEEYKKDAEDDSDEQEPVQSLEEYMQDHQIGTMSEINCRWDAMLGKIVESSSVYLYPCMIEYSLVCACVLYVMWSNVGDGDTVVKRTDSCSDIDTLDSEDDSEDENAHHRMSVDCAASSKGLFLGILLFVIAVVCIVCFYVLTSVRSHVATGTLLGHVSEEVILILAFIATATAAFQMRHMRFSGHRKVGIEEILSLVSISGLGLYGIWSIIAAVFHLDTLHGRLTLVTNLFMLVQAGSQATFTLAALRASARNHEQLREKPGKQCVTFLIICNFALWVVNTFETQRIEYNQTQVNFYGTTAWAIFSHISVPLGIFFRFNATVNLSIVWKKAWKKKDADGNFHTQGTHST